MGATTKTVALDLAAILDLLKFSKNTFGNYQDWRCINGDQTWFISLLKNDGLEISEPQNISITGSTSISVKSILNRDICWEKMIVSPETILKGGKIYSAFRLSQGFDIFKVNYFDNEPLLVTKTDKGDYLCLMMTNQWFSMIDLLKKVFSILQGKKICHPAYDENTEVIIPKIEISLFVDICFMKGLFYSQNDLRCFIKEIKQEIVLSIGNKDVRTNLKTRVDPDCRLSEVLKKRLVLDRPVIGFLVSKLDMKSSLPSMVFYADFESWKRKQF